MRVDAVGNKFELAAGALHYQNLALPGLLVVGLVLRLWHLNGALWYDEAFSAWLAALPLGQLIEAARGDVHPPTYYLLLAAVTRLAGQSEAALRLPSVLAGLGTIYMVFRLAGSLGLSRRAALLAGAICTLSPFAIYYSQEARAYSLLMLATTTTAWGVTGRRWGWAAAGTLAALYLNNLAVLFLMGIWVGGLIVAYRQVNEALENFSLDVTELRHNFFWGAMALIWVLVGALPAFYMAVQQAQAVGGGYWIPPLASPSRLLATIDDLLWFSPDSPFIIATALITGWLLVLAAGDLVSGIRAGIEAIDTKKNGPVLETGPFSPLVFLWVAIGFPLAAITLISLAWQPLLISRAVAPLAPLLYILVAVALDRSQARLRLFAALAVPTLACILILSPGRAAVDRDMLDRVPPGQALYHANVGSYLVWKYYRPDLTQYVWPQQTTLKQTLTHSTRVAMGLQEVDFEFVKCVAVADGLGAVTRPGWWLIYFHNPTTSRAEIEYVAGLEARYGAGPGALLRHDQAVEARLIRLQPDCASLPP